LHITRAPKIAQPAFVIARCECYRRKLTNLELSYFRRLVAETRSTADVNMLWLLVVLQCRRRVGSVQGCRLDRKLFELSTTRLASSSLSTNYRSLSVTWLMTLCRAGSAGRAGGATNCQLAAVACR